jgi:hypothetical protein
MPKRFSTALAISAAMAGAVFAFPLLAAAQGEQITQTVSTRIRAIADAERVQALLDARRRLIEDFEFYNGQNEGFDFARAAAQQVVPLLNGGIAPEAPLSLLKQVNLAIALAQMPHVSVQPALRAMVAHGSPAVRYHGWLGYQRSRGRLLENSLKTQDMLQDLRTAAAGEEEPLVLGQLWRLCVFPDARPSVVPARNWTVARETAAEALLEQMPRWSRRLAVELPDGEQAGVLAVEMRHLLAATASLAGDADTQLRRQWIQQVYALAWYASRLYKQAADLEPADADSALQLDRLANAALLLTLSCEGTLQDLSGETRSFVADVLEGDREGRAARVRLAVINDATDPAGGWLGALERFEVSEPDEGEGQ